MKEVSIIGLDLAKQVFQLHGATAQGDVAFCKRGGVYLHVETQAEPSLNHRAISPAITARP